MFLLEYWYLVPTIMSVASIIAKATPNETDNKIIATLQQIVDVVAFSSKPTELTKKNLKG